MGQPAFPMNKPGLPASEQFNEPYKKDQFEGVPQGFIPKQIFMQSQLTPRGSYSQEPLSFDQSMSQAMDQSKPGENSIQVIRRAFGGVPQYQGSILGSQTGNPIQFGDTTSQYSFIGQQPTPDYRSQTFGDTKPITMTDESKNTPYVQGPQVQYDPTKDRSKQQFSVEGDFKRKWKGVGETVGQWAIPAVNKLSSMLEQKDYKKAKKKLEESMLADNTFMTSPLNAKNRGDYDPNSGMFRPDQMVPVQFPGYAQWGGFNTMAMGGSYEEGEELDLSPEEIEELRQQGYEIEYLD